jgi:hypothetical protein
MNKNTKTMTVLYYSIPLFSILIICTFLFLKYVQCSITKETPSFLNNVRINTINTTNTTKKLPKNLFLTYHDKKKIPKRVLDRYYTFTNNEFNIYILDDNDAIQFFKQYNFPPIIIKKYNSFKKGAHKADLLRYCLLYIYGGVYLDIKTELIENLTTSFDFDTEYPLTTHVLYTLHNFVKITIYQGIMVSTPKNPILKTLIYNILETSDILIDLNYHILVQQCKYILEYYNQDPNYLIYLYQEKCDTFLLSSLHANEERDRYGFVCYGYTNKDRLFVKIRDSEYPYK